MLSYAPAMAFADKTPYADDRVPNKALRAIFVENNTDPKLRKASQIHRVNHITFVLQRPDGLC